MANRLLQLPLAEILLEAMLEHPAEAVDAAVKAINARISPEMDLSFTKANQPAPAAGEGRSLLTIPVRNGSEEAGSLHLIVPAADNESASRQAASEVARLVGKVAALQERHNRLQRLAITDELTGLSNARYFRHFLSLILERARKMHFPVTLLLFDIDNFKKYNDQFGHGTGDDILSRWRPSCGGAAASMIWWPGSAAMNLPSSSGTRTARAAADAQARRKLPPAAGAAADFRAIQGTDFQRRIPAARRDREGYADRQAGAGRLSLGRQ